MGKVRKSAFRKVALFCLVFLFVCLISVYALAETRQNERFVLKDIPLQQIGPASRVIVMESTDKDYPYLVTDAHAAGYEFNGIGEGFFPSGIQFSMKFVIRNGINNTGNLRFKWQGTYGLSPEVKNSEIVGTKMRGLGLTVYFKSLENMVLPC